MIKQKRVLFILIGAMVIIGILTNLYSFHKSSFKYLIESTFDIELPSDSQIIKSSYDYNSGNFQAKILIRSNSISFIKEQLNKFFHEPYKGGFSGTPNPGNICQWWDLDKNNIDTYYFEFRGGFPARSHEIWMFITKEKNEKSYLYISY